MKKFWMFVLAIVISFIPGIIGGFFSPMSPGTDVWYNSLNQSVLTPNGWVFLVAWLILYTLLGISLFLIMSNDKPRQNKSGAYALFVIQMGLNALWSYLFFGLQMIGGALLTLVTLIAITIWMMVPTFVLSAYGMNVALPLSQHPNAFWMLMGICLLLVWLVIMFWRHKNW